MEEKWKVLIEACKNYYIDSIPTGFTDAEYDELEARALQEDNFSVRDYVFEKYLKGTKAENHYIEKFIKTKVSGTMLDAMSTFGSTDYWTIKYDGSSIGIYPDPTSGIPKRVITCGNGNRSSLGVDQTWKLLKFLPKRFPKGIVAIQCEALIDLNRLPSGLDPDRARQKTNGMINSIYLEEEVNNLLTLRAYRYYLDDSTDGKALGRMDYKDVISSFETVYSPIDNHILFAPADIFTLSDLKNNPGYCETDRVITSTGAFLADGWVRYQNSGICLGALKFAGAGSTTETTIKTIVRGLQWNNQISKNKDSWSANVLIDPVVLRGSTVRKPSAGSVSKLVENNITPGAEVSIILANSTIPAIGKCYKPGNGDFQWPKCSCGYQMSEKDVYGSLLKCGNQRCSERLGRMKVYLGTLENVHSDLDLNKLLVIDRFKWEDTDISIDKLLEFVEKQDSKGYYNYLMSFMNTPLRLRNMELVWLSSWTALSDLYNQLCS